MMRSTHTTTHNHSPMPTCILNHTRLYSALPTHTWSCPLTLGHAHAHTRSHTSLMFPTFLWTSQQWDSSPFAFSSTASSPWWSVPSSLQKPNTRQHNMLPKAKMHRMWLYMTKIRTSVLYNTDVDSYIQHASAYAHTCTTYHKHTHTHMHACTHACTHAAHTHAHTHTHIHTHTERDWFRSARSPQHHCYSQQ